MSSFSISDLKNRALASLRSNWADAVIVTLVFYLICGAITHGIFFYGNRDEMRLTLYVIEALLYGPIAWAFIVMFLDFIRGEKLGIGKLFDGYRENWLHIFTTYLLVEIYTFLWTLLFIVPGIIKALSYSQTFFILKDNPELSNNAAIEKSMRMMKGHKMELFTLYLSFIGWAILSLLTLGIGFLLLVPYISTTLAHFYEQLKDNE